VLILYCSKLLKHSIQLPCDESICREHLTERGVLKQNKIKCNEFKSIVAFNQFKERQSYLVDEERSLKQELEDKIRNFFQFYEDFVQLRGNMDSDVFDVFSRDALSNR
jgi:hypothetical protein